VPDLVACGIVDRVDLPMLATQYARIQGGRRVIEERGYFTNGSVGQIREHPGLKIEREATVLFDRLAQQFGLGPLGRTLLGLAKVTRRALADELRDGSAGQTLRPGGVVADVSESTVSENLSGPGVEAAKCAASPRPRELQPAP
jgi:hypothetical protein